jgi:hypothetical protein
VSVIRSDESSKISGEKREKMVYLDKTLSPAEFNRDFLLNPVYFFSGESVKHPGSAEILICFRMTDTGVFSWWYPNRL